MLRAPFVFRNASVKGVLKPPRLWLKMAVQILWNVEPEWMRKHTGLHMPRSTTSTLQLHVRGQLLDLRSPEDAPGGDDDRLDREVGRGTKTSKFVVDKHLWCRREEGRHKGQDENKATHIAREKDQDSGIRFQLGWVDAGQLGREDVECEQGLVEKCEDL